MTRDHRGWFAATVVASVLAATTALGGAAGGDEYQNVVIVLDASGSMAARIEGQPKMDVAKQVVGDLVRNLPSAMNVGLIAYGAKSPRDKRDCGDIELLQPVSPADPRALEAAVRSVSARGMTPIGGSLRAAAEALRSARGPSTIVLVTDGVESCNADPCAVAREVHEQTGVEIKVQVVGLALGDSDRKLLECVASDGGGRYYRADTAAELKTAISEAIAKPPPPRGGTRAMWMSILHPGLGEWKNSGKTFDDGCPKGKFWLGMIPVFGWPGYLQVISAIDAYAGRTNDWPEE